MSDDVSVSGSGGWALRRRRFNKSLQIGAFSPSYGVRRGYLADVERPLPADLENLRKARRMPMSFEVCIGGTWRRAAGDVSTGGALVLLPFAAAETQFQVRVRMGEKEWMGMSQLLSTSERGARYAHHVRFTDPAAWASLAEHL